MKKIMICAALLICVCACKNDNTTIAELPLPETFEEFMEGAGNLEELTESSISSDDSVTTNYYALWIHSYDLRGFDSKSIHESDVVNDSVANLLAEEQAFSDSVLNREMSIMDYVDNSMTHLREKYRPTAAKYYEYEMHRGGVDSLEFIIAPKELVDSLPEDCQGMDFKDNYRWYPEFFSYMRRSEVTKKEKRVTDCIRYHKEEKHPGKKLTNEEEVKQLFLNRIKSIKGVKSESVRYLSDDGRFNLETVSFAWRLKKEPVALLEGTLYEIPLKGEDKVKLVKDLRSSLVDFMKTHYAPYMELNFYPNHDMTVPNTYDQALMGISINNHQNSGHARSLSGLFRVQVGNFADKSLKILFLNVRNETFIIPRDWMEIKEVHNDTIRWLPNGIMHNGTVTTTKGEVLSTN